MILSICVLRADLIWERGLRELVFELLYLLVWYRNVILLFVSHIVFVRCLRRVGNRADVGKSKKASRLKAGLRGSRTQHPVVHVYIRKALDALFYRRYLAHSRRSLLPQYSSRSYRHEQSSSIPGLSARMLEVVNGSSHRTQKIVS